MNKSKVIAEMEILVERILKSSATISDRKVKNLAEKWVADNYSDLLNIVVNNSKEQKSLKYLYKSVHNERLLKNKWLKNLRKIIKWLKQSNYSSTDSIISFDPQKPFTAYKILKILFSKAKNKIFIYDGYVEEGTLDILSNVPKHTKIKILTNNTYGKFSRELNKFRKEFTNCEVRQSTSVHDRFFFIDKQSYVVGMSLHSLGRNKASHIFNIPSEIAKILKNHFTEIWKQAKVL